LGEKYPFGMKGPFDGLNLRATAVDGRQTTVQYRPNAKQRLAHNCCADEIFYGGAVGGGKSYFLLWHNALHCINHKAAANTVLFRRTYDELEGSLILDHVMLFDGVLGKYLKDDRRFNWDSGAVTWFRHLEKPEDVRKHLSRQYTLIGFDELTHFTYEMYSTLFGRLRSARDRRIHPQILSASNPRGIGHRWVKERFVEALVPNVVHEFQLPAEMGGQIYTRIYIPAVLDDNTALMDADPLYKGRMRVAMTEDMYHAYVEGDWDFFELMAFPEWDAETHVVDDFTVPAHWKVIRAIDWGYSSPFSVGWWAQDPDTKAIYRVAEWYGGRRGAQGAIHGLQMSGREVRQGILDRERANVQAGNWPAPWDGVGAQDMWSHSGSGACVADLINEGSQLFHMCNRDRMLGLQAIHRALRMDPATGSPGLMCFRSCKEFTKQIDNLLLDERNPEDIAPRQEDHVYDETRYAVVELLESPAFKADPEEQYWLERGMRRPVLV